MHDADPLEHVAAAWVELFEERATLGTLELEVEALLALFATGEAVMPDYYVVPGPRDRGHVAALVARRARAPRALARAARRGIRSRTAGAAARAARVTAVARASAWLPHVHFDIPDRVGLRDQPGAA